jgi:hypothetical protein
MEGSSSHRQRPSDLQFILAGAVFAALHQLAGGNLAIEVEWVPNDLTTSSTIKVTGLQSGDVVLVHLDSTDGES